MKKRNRGFTLIELIIVVSILAILVGLLAPQYTKYVEKSRRAACDANIETLEREYQIVAMEEPPGTAENAQAILGEIVESHGGELVANGSSLINGGVFTGFCKKKGNYQCMIPEGFLYVEIICSVHGTEYIDVRTLKERLESIKFSDIPGWSAPFKTLDEYFKTKSKSLDSEAVGTNNADGAYGAYKSMADALNAQLNKQGINTDGRSWRMYKDESEYNLFLTERTITESDITDNSWIKCEKYLINEKKVVYGEVQVTMCKPEAGKFPVINGSSFREIKK